MKKNNKKEILFLFLFIVILVVIEVVLLGINTSKVAKEKDNYSEKNETSEEINLGDACTDCVNYCVKTSGKDEERCRSECTSSCSVVKGVCCCTQFDAYCSWIANVSYCPTYQPNQHSGNSSNCHLFTKTPAASSSLAPTASAAPVDNCYVVFDHFNMGSIGSSQTINVTAYNCRKKTISIKGSNGVNVNYKETAQGNPSSISTTISYGGSCGSMGSYTVTYGSKSETQKVLLANAWQRKYNYSVDHLPAYVTSEGADANSGWEYGFNCVTTYNGIYTCSEYGWRSCGGAGSVPDTTAPPVSGVTVQYPSCWANAKSLYDATKAEWRTGASGDMTHKITKLDDAKSVKITQELCVPMKKATYCIPKEITPDEQKITTDKCEADLTINYDDGKDCSGNKFYKLSCKNTINIQYDNGDDKDEDNKTGTVNNIIVGGGFEFGINTAIKRECEATFDIDNNWTNAYKKSVKQLDTLEKAIKVASNADQKALESRIYELKNKINEIKQVAKDYNDEMEKINFEATATALVKYKDSSGKEKNSSATFASTVLDAGSINLKKVKELKLIKDELTVYNYKWNNNSNPKIVKLNFPKTYINPITGKIADDGTGIDGGNKLYFEYDANSSKNGDQSTIELVLKRTVNKKDLVIITNTCCKVAEYSSQVKYRPISLTNPFINKDYKKGANWVNSMYDFTKTIKSNVWDGKPVYDIELTAQQVSDLKYSNVRNQSDSPYLGLCDRVKTSMQDDITKKLCSLIK